MGPPCPWPPLKGKPWAGGSPRSRAPSLPTAPPHSFSSRQPHRSWERLQPPAPCPLTPPWRRDARRDGRPLRAVLKYTGVNPGSWNCWYFPEVLLSPQCSRRNVLGALFGYSPPYVDSHSLPHPNRVSPGHQQSLSSPSPPSLRRRSLAPVTRGRQWR